MKNHVSIFNKNTRHFTLGLTAMLAFCSITLGATSISSVNYSSNAVSGNDVTISTSGAGKVKITMCKPDVARVWVVSNGNFSKNNSYAVEKESWDPVTFTVNDKGTYVQILSSGLSIRINKTPLGISFYNADDATAILQERTSGGGIGLDNPSAYWAMGSDEHFFGAGQDNDIAGGALDRTKTVRTFYTGQQMNTDRGVVTNIIVPFFMSTGKAGNGYGLFYDNSYKTTIDFGKESSSYHYWKANGGDNVFYFINGPLFPKILDRYTELTGRAPLAPLWVMGYMQSNCWYTSWSAVDAVLNPLQKAGIPVDAMVLDMPWNSDATYFDYKWSSGFSNAATKMSDYKKVGIKIMIINDPMIMTTSSAYTTGKSKGMFAKCSGGDCTAGWYTGKLLDPTADGFTDWNWGNINQLYKDGVGAWWLDLTEPENEPTDATYKAGNSALIRNAFSNFYSKAYYDGQKKNYPNDRNFILTRSGFAGIQKYGAGVWTGDINTNYTVFNGHIPEVQSCGISGINWWGSDCGGFTGGCLNGDCSGAQGKLYQRWMQFTCFVPLCRAHSNSGTNSPIHFPQSVQDNCKKYISLRYRLLPYIYSYAQQNTQTGAPLTRPLVFDYQKDVATYDKKSEFLFGKELLVAPVTKEGGTSQSVYFPEGTWYDYDNGTSYPGKTTATVNAPLEKLPLFVKAGAIIPMAPLMMYTGQKAWDPLTLDIYPSGNSSFTLYQDDGKTMDFQTTKKFTETKITCQETPGKSVVVTIDESNKNFTPATYEFSIHLPAQSSAPTPIQLNGVAVSVVTSAAYSSSKEGLYWDATAKILWVKGAAASGNNQVLAVSLDGQPVAVNSLKALRLSPEKYSLTATMPSRASFTPMINFAVPQNAGLVNIELFDLQGKVVSHIVNEQLIPGYYSKAINVNLGSKQYLCRMNAKGYEKTVMIKGLK